MVNMRKPVEVIAESQIRAALARAGQSAAYPFTGQPSTPLVERLGSNTTPLGTGWFQTVQLRRPYYG